MFMETPHETNKIICPMPVKIVLREAGNIVSPFSMTKDVHQPEKAPVMVDFHNSGVSAL